MNMLRVLRQTGDALRDRRFHRRLAAIVADVRLEVKLRDAGLEVGKLEQSRQETHVILIRQCSKLQAHGRDVFRR